jgi:hypothetical protein
MHWRRFLSQAVHGFFPSHAILLVRQALQATATRLLFELDSAADGE